MFKARKHLSYANITATLALVFAMSGGAAYAASHYLITSTKQIKPSVLASLKGKAGPVGPAGASGVGTPGAQGGQGLQGAKGENGSKGANGVPGTNGAPGTNGKNGKSVEATAATTGAGGECQEGGTKFEVEDSGSSEHVCNGEKGAEGNIKKTLPPGMTETGTWSLVENTGLAPGERVPQRVSMSFPIPLAASLPAKSCSHASGTPECRIQVVEVGQTGTGNCEGGTAEEPTAKPGYVCVYIKALEGANTNFFYPESARVGVAGMVLGILTEGEHGGEAEGTWAVTAE